MGILDNFEKGLERAVNGAFAKTFRSGCNRSSSRRALRRELDTKAAVVIARPHSRAQHFALRMSPSDYEKMRALGPPSPTS